MPYVCVFASTSPESSSGSRGSTKVGSGRQLRGHTSQRATLCFLTHQQPAWGAHSRSPALTLRPCYGEPRSRALLRLLPASEFRGAPSRWVAYRLLSPTAPATPEGQPPPQPTTTAAHKHQPTTTPALPTDTPPVTQSPAATKHLCPKLRSSENRPILPVQALRLPEKT